jgi:hypothetical protein
MARTRSKARKHASTDLWLNSVGAMGYRQRSWLKTSIARNERRITRRTDPFADDRDNA